MHLNSKKRAPRSQWEDWGFTLLSWWVCKHKTLGGGIGGEGCTRARLPDQIITPACISAVSAWGPVERRVGGPLSKQRAEGNRGPYGVSRTTEVFNPVVTCSPRRENKAPDLLLAPHTMGTHMHRGPPDDAAHNWGVQEKRVERKKGRKKGERWWSCER